MTLTDRIRNVLTGLTAVVAVVFHRDVTSYVAAAAVLAAGLDLTITAALRAHGSILARIEDVFWDLAHTAAQATAALPAATPPVVTNISVDAGKVADKVLAALGQPVAAAVTQAVTEAAPAAPATPAPAPGAAAPPAAPGVTPQA